MLPYVTNSVTGVNGVTEKQNLFVQPNERHCDVDFEIHIISTTNEQSNDPFKFVGILR